VDDPDSNLSEALRRLRHGRLVAFPTETVYGLGASAGDARAVADLYRAKARPGDVPLIAHVSGIEMARGCAACWCDAADTLARAFWPGPLTIIVPRAASIPAIVAGGGDTIAVRCPDHPMTLGLLRALGGAIAGTSANVSGRISPTTADDVRASFPDVLILDGGRCAGGIESTVVRAEETRVVVVRRGVLGPEALRAALGAGVEITDRVAGLARGATGGGVRVVDEAELGGVGSDAVVLTIGPVACGGRRIVMPTDAAGYARRLYSAVREGEAMGGQEIVIQCPPAAGRSERETAVWRAVRDRLERLTGG